MTTTETRRLSTIAREITKTWAKVDPGAVPYLEAMSKIDSITTRYYADDADTIVMYFLSNAKSWRGEDARRIKAELRAML